MRTLERRAFTLSNIQIRKAADSGLHFTGRAVVYDQLSVDMGGWQEVIKPGAAARTLAANPDVALLINHDSNRVLARTVSGTCRLTDTPEGLDVDADMADVSYARDMAVSLERGDVTQMSFAFWITRDEWSGNLHVVHEFDLDGGDVSIVTFPAFQQTSAQLASAELRSAASTQLEQLAGYPLDLAKRRLRLLEMEVLS